MAASAQHILLTDNAVTTFGSTVYLTVTVQEEEGAHTSLGNLHKNCGKSLANFQSDKFETLTQFEVIDHALNTCRDIMPGIQVDNEVQMENRPSEVYKVYICFKTNRVWMVNLKDGKVVVPNGIRMD